MPANNTSARNWDDEIGPVDLEELIDAAQDSSPVSGLTHDFYRYPARFSPAFVRAAILSFTEPGDWVLDPFVGGGTTLVEAMAVGRHSVGLDISSLATFVCQAKTIVVDDAEHEALRRWGRAVPDHVNIHLPARELESSDLHRHLDSKEVWRVRKAIDQALASVERIRLVRAQMIARCAVLRTAQWALDTRKIIPSVEAFRQELETRAEKVRRGALALRAAAEAVGRRKAIAVNRSAAQIADESAVTRIKPPKLIVTSPPYPGIHVLYHRWQIGGGKEAPAPFWIANKLDGAGSSYYTMGDRHNPELSSYFEQLATSFRAIARVAGRDTTIVQMVAFSEPGWQLKRYLEVMEACGLEEFYPWDEAGHRAKRLWREVPNRKWHARQRDAAPGAREVVLVHRKKRRA